MRELVQALIEFLVDLARTIFDYLMRFFKAAIDKFLEINIFEKLIVFTIIPAFFAVILSVGRFYIFDTYFYLNNPLAVYMIGIVIIMLIGLYIRHVATFIIRELVCAYYLFWIFYRHLGSGLAKTQYELTFGYYLNIIVPVLFMIFSLLSFLIYRDEYL